MELLLAAFIKDMADKYPVVLSIISVMGMARLFLKPVMTFLHEIVLITPSKKDNELLKKAEESKASKSLKFVLDYLFSLKIGNQGK